MRRTLVLLVAWSLMLNLGRAADPELLSFERRTPAGTLTKRYTYYLKDGEQVEHGLFEGFYPDGKRFNRGNREHGKLHGLYTLYYERIEKTDTELTYRNGKLHGLRRWWSPKGELLTECEYRDGKPWAGRTSTNSTSSSGSIETTETKPTFLYQNGKRVANSKKTITVNYPTQLPNDLPDMGSFLRWSFYTYKINSSYPFLNQLPPYDKVPFLIDWCAKQKDQSNIAHEQLVALTRADFGDMRAVDPETRRAETEAWKSWWDSTGKDRDAYAKKHGVRDETAWKIVARGRDLPMPELPIAIPATYSMKLSFRSGDYGGIINETITLTREESEASLVRVYTTKTDGEKTTQHWQPFSTTDADRIARAVGYMIDHPWLMNDEREINRRFWKEQTENGGASVNMMPFAHDRIKGRESFHMYYPSATFTMNTSDGLVWWNDDPRRWSGNVFQARFLRVAQPVSSTVYPFIAALYSESEQVSDEVVKGWKTVSE